MDKVLAICHNILVTNPGVSRVILADKTGLTLANLSRFDFEFKDVEALGAISSAVYLASEQQGSNVGLVEMTMLVAEFKGGKIMVASCGSAVLCVITDNDVTLGMARIAINQAAKKIETILNERVQNFGEIPSFDQVKTENIEFNAPLEQEDFLSEIESRLSDI